MKPQIVPDWVATDPHNSPVWEITGTEFRHCSTMQERAFQPHSTADISIRFPRVTRVREDKTWQTATTLSELKHLASITQAVQPIQVDDNQTPEFPIPPSKRQKTAIGGIKEGGAPAVGGVNNLTVEQRSRIVAECCEDLISPTDLARKWNCNADSIRTWVRKAGRQLPEQYKKAEEKDAEQPEQSKVIS